MKEKCQRLLAEREENGREINELKENKKQLIEEKRTLSSEKEVLKQVSLELFRKRKVYCLIARCGEMRRKLRLTKVRLQELRWFSSEAKSNNLRQHSMITRQFLKEQANSAYPVYPAQLSVLKTQALASSSLTLSKIQPNFSFSLEPRRTATLLRNSTQPATTSSILLR